MRSSIGVRERNRIDKLQRITEAARTLFVEKGFDETTTREIARRANVALGTLFLYATDKRDLLFLICTDELEDLTDRAFDAVPARKTKGHATATDIANMKSSPWEKFGDDTADLLSKRGAALHGITVMHVSSLHW